MTARSARNMGHRGTTGEEAASGFSHFFCCFNVCVVETPHVDHRRRVFLCSSLRSSFFFLPFSLPAMVSLAELSDPSDPKVREEFCKKLGRACWTPPNQSCTLKRS
jgi:hypothetical protein